MEEFKIEDEESIDSLGTRLRKAREYKGLGVHSVAHQLNLTQPRVIDMENDDYRFAVAESYAKGYLRLYAKLLGLDPDLISQEFDRQNFSETIQHHETKLIINRQISSGDRWMRWVTYSIGMLLVFLVAIWWRSQPNHSDTGTVVSESSDQSTTDISAQATRKTAAQEQQPSQNLSDEVRLLQKPGLSPAQVVEDSASDSSQKTELPLPTEAGKKGSTTSDSKPSSTTAQTPATLAADKSTKTSPTQKAAVTPKVAPKAVEEESDEDSEDEEEDTSDVQGFNLIKPLKPKVILGQREQDERALLQELEKVFGRG